MQSNVLTISDEEEEQTEQQGSSEKLTKSKRTDSAWQFFDIVKEKK